MIRFAMAQGRLWDGHVRLPDVRSDGVKAALVEVEALIALVEPPPAPTALLDRLRTDPVPEVRDGALTCLLARADLREQALAIPQTHPPLAVRIAAQTSDVDRLEALLSTPARRAAALALARLGPLARAPEDVLIERIAGGDGEAIDALGAAGSARALPALDQALGVLSIGAAGRRIRSATRQNPGPVGGRPGPPRADRRRSGGRRVVVTLRGIDRQARTPGEVSRCAVANRHRRWPSVTHRSATTERPRGQHGGGLRRLAARGGRVGGDRGVRADPLDRRDDRRAAYPTRAR